MPLDLKNVGATFQHLMDKIFKTQIVRNLEVGVDDILVKYKVKEDHWQDLVETFYNLRKPNVKLKPNKCVFGVIQGKFLDNIISLQVIKLNPEKSKKS